MLEQQTGNAGSNAENKQQDRVEKIGALPTRPADPLQTLTPLLTPVPSFCVSRGLHGRPGHIAALTAAPPVHKSATLISCRLPSHTTPSLVHPPTAPLHLLFFSPPPHPIYHILKRRTKLTIIVCCVWRMRCCDSHVNLGMANKSQTSDRQKNTQMIHWKRQIHQTTK